MREEREAVHERPLKTPLAFAPDIELGKRMLGVNDGNLSPMRGLRVDNDILVGSGWNPCRGTQTRHRTTDDFRKEILEGQSGQNDTERGYLRTDPT